MSERNRNGKGPCWVDLFQMSEFSGRMRRIFGPGKIDEPVAASMIVGPQARVEMTIVRLGKESIINFESNRLVTNLKTNLGGAKIASITIHCPPRARQKRSKALSTAR